MEVEEFAFDFIHQASAYSAGVKRFPVDKELRLWTLLRRPRGGRADIYFLGWPYSGTDGWRSLNDKRDELMKLIAKTPAKKSKH